MARTLIGIVRDSVSGEVRRIIIPDEDYQLAHHANVGYDETFHIETHPDPIGNPEIIAIVQRDTGK